MKGKMSRKISGKITIFKAWTYLYNGIGRFDVQKRRGTDMNDCDRLMREMAEQARKLGIPVSKQIEPHVKINRRAVNRLGCCRRQGGGYVIELAARVAEGAEEVCRETLAHELLHTCTGCQNHGALWKEYARRMNGAYGYKIKRVAVEDAMRGIQPRPFKYLVRCERCGAELGRYRASPLTRHPERYRCRCGGKLKRADDI